MAYLKVWLKAPSRIVAKFNNRKLSNSKLRKESKVSLEVLPKFNIALWHNNMLELWLQTQSGNVA